MQDRLVLLGQGVPSEIEDRVGRVLSALGRAKRTDLGSPSLLDADVPLPDTRIAREAVGLCRTILPVWLEAHCYRTYAIGVLLGRRLSFDPEILFVASMLHDVGLAENFEQGSAAGLPSGYPWQDAPCFAIRGAGFAQSQGTLHRWPPASRNAIAEAISLHLNVRVARSRGVEAHLLNAGSALDVVRLNSHRLQAESIRDIERRWPRENNFCDDLWTAWAREAEAADHRRCRGAFLNRWGCFKHRIHWTCPSRYEKPGPR